MKPINNFDSVEVPNEHRRLTPGGYVCRITKVEDVADKEYLRIEYDIAEGSLKGYWDDNDERYGWRDSFVRSYKEKAHGFFKQFVQSVEQSNSGYVWKWDEQTLKGKLVGIILSEEEYEKRDGSIGSRLKANKTVSVDRIRSGDYTVPAKKTLSVNERTSAPAVTDDDLPFDF